MAGSSPSYSDSGGLGDSLEPAGLTMISGGSAAKDTQTTRTEALLSGDTHSASGKVGKWLGSDARKWEKEDWPDRGRTPVQAQGCPPRHPSCSFMPCRVRSSSRRGGSRKSSTCRAGKESSSCLLMPNTKPVPADRRAQTPAGPTQSQTRGHPKTGQCSPLTTSVRSLLSCKYFNNN